MSQQPKIKDMSEELKEACYDAVRILSRDDQGNPTNGFTHTELCDYLLISGYRPTPEERKPTSKSNTQQIWKRHISSWLQWMIRHDEIIVHENRGRSAKYLWQNVQNDSGSDSEKISKLESEISALKAEITNLKGVFKSCVDSDNILTDEILHLKAQVNAYHEILSGLQTTVKTHVQGASEFRNEMGTVCNDLANNHLFLEERIKKLYNNLGEDWKQ